MSPRRRSSWPLVAWMLVACDTTTPASDPTEDAAVVDAARLDDAAPADAAPTDAAPAPFGCGGCAEGEICVFTGRNQAQPRCVRPQCVDYGPTALTLVAPAVGWYRKVLDDAEANDLVCNDGCPYAYYVRPGIGADVDNWVIFFKGGGGCATDPECARRWVEQRGVMTQKAAQFTPTGRDPTNQDADQHGVFARDRGDNYFAGWTQVYLHYCSSDTFVGTAHAGDNGLGLAFRGHAITQAVVGELIAGVIPDGPRLVDADAVLIWGGSAGAAGARRNMDRIADAIWSAQDEASPPVPHATIKGFPDSAMTPPLHPRAFAGYDRLWTIDYWKAVLDDDCAAAHPGDDAQLCQDAVHMLTGKGAAAGDAVHGRGHLRTVNDVFVFMDQYDANSLRNLEIGEMCLRRECNASNPCTGGAMCIDGICWTPQACTPEPCRESPCFAIDGPPACLEEQAVHANVCDTDDDCLVADGEVCVAGFCAFDVHRDCNDAPDTACDTAAGFSCGADGVCAKPATGAGDCDDPRYELDTELEQCREVTGCNERHPCPMDLTHRYACVSRRRTPFAQMFAYGVRQALGDPAITGAYSPTTGTHTAASSHKYYITHFGDDNLATVLGRWFAELDPETHGPYKRIRRPPPVNGD